MGACSVTAALLWGRQRHYLSRSQSSLTASCHGEAALLPLPWLHFIQLFPALICVHMESVLRSKLHRLLASPKCFLCFGSRAQLSTHSGRRGARYKDKEVRKAGSAQLSVAASHKWSLIVSSKCTLTHLLARAQSY